MIALGEAAGGQNRKMRPREASQIARQLLVGFFDAPERRLHGIHALAAKGWADGHISDDEYTLLLDAATLRQDVFNARRLVPNGRCWKSEAWSKAQRFEGVRKRRTWSTSGALPPRLRAHFTPGENAVAAVIRAEVRRHGSCSLSHTSIAKSAGLASTTVVKRFVRHARALGLIKVAHRPIPGGRHKTNVVTIVSAEWQAWNEAGPRESTPRPARQVGDVLPNLTGGGGGTGVPSYQKKDLNHRYNAYGERVGVAETPLGGLGNGRVPPTAAPNGRRRAPW